VVAAISPANAMGSLRLLLVEDEPALADLLRRYLERLGYQVDACADANAALALLDAHPEDYALLITDLSLPDMSGDELMTRSRLRAPHLRAIIASGYPYEPRVAGVEFLQKPFLPNLLAQAVERALKA
jgi:CheY-like chemotaxis protein